MESRFRFRVWCVLLSLRSLHLLSCALYRPSRADRDAEEKDLIIIGGGVAGYVAAIKAGQEGMKVR